MQVKRSEDALRLRATEEERTELEAILAVEGGTMTELLVEGLWRVIENRRDNPRFQSMRRQIVLLQAEVDKARKDLH